MGSDDCPNLHIPMFSNSAVKVKRRAEGFPSGRDIEPLGWFQSIFRLIQKLLCGQKPSNLPNTAPAG